MITKMRRSCWQVKARVEALVPVDVIDNPNLHSFFFTCDDDIVLDVIKHFFTEIFSTFESNINYTKNLLLNNFNFVMLLFVIDEKKHHNLWC